MPTCSIVFCKNRSDKTNFQTDGITFHRFPKDGKLKEKWITATGRGPVWWPVKKSTICSVHFREDQFRPLPKSRRLFDWAVPTLQLPYITSCIKDLPSKPNVTKMDVLTMVTDPDKNMEMVTEPLDDPEPISIVATNSYSKIMSAVHSKKVDVAYFGEPSSQLQIVKLPTKRKCEESVSLPKASVKIEKNDNMETGAGLEETPCNCKMRLQIESYKTDVKKRVRKIRSLKTKSSRYRKRIADLQCVLNELKDNNFVNSDHVTHLENLGVPDLIKKISSNQNLEDKYSPELRTFACTLHFYSPKAYQYVRQKFQTCLPHVRTVKRWYESIDAEPGFTKESFEALKLKVSNTNHNLLCNLVLDEIAIRQRVEWDGKQMHGYFDIICSSNKKGDSLPEAKEALVFLVTAINDSFKIPVGYFLVDGVTGEQRANLVIQCLELLQETGVEITSLTFDGCPANLTMAKVLGCSFDLKTNLKTNFQNPASYKPIHIFPDPCHMLKLLRNAFEANGSFIDDTQKEVKWAHLKQLNSLQEQEKLLLANKLRRNNLFFKDQKMKERSASQLFSNSVADALTCCAQLNLPGFKNVDGTVNFLKVVNDLFDVLNSRHMAQLHYKKPLSANNKEHIFGFLEKAENYLRNLKLLDGNNVINTSRKTGIVGFLACINSLKDLYIQLVEKEQKLVYLPAYKISQDHLELLFGQIRSHGGCNTNPTARQFKAIYKKLMVRSELSDVDNGNCHALEKVTILTCSTAVKRINSTVEARFREDTDDCVDINELYEMAVFDEEIDIMVQNLTEFSAQTVRYIAGFLVHSLMKTLKCETCISALLADSTEDTHKKFIKHMDKSGLLYPSKDVVTICKQMETIIKSTVLTQNKITVSTKNVKEVLMCKAFPHFVGMNLFQDYDFHQYEQSPLDNHLIILIKAVMEKYINTRLHYLTKNDVPKLSIRQLFSKYLHFQDKIKHDGN